MRCAAASGRPATPTAALRARLGAAAADGTPHEPVAVDVQVRLARASWLDGYTSCVSWVALVFVVLMLVGWVLSC